MLSMYRVFQNETTCVVVSTFAFAVERISVRRPNKCIVVTSFYDTV